MSIKPKITARSAKNSAVLFDLDGTLIDTAPDFIHVVNHQRQSHQLPPLDALVIRNTVSNGARALIELSFNLTEGDPGYNEKHTELLDLYLEHLAVNSCLFPGMEELLSWLDDSGIAWGIVTNKPRRFTEPLLAGLQLHERCKSVVCPDDVTHRKPNPEPLHLACTQLGKTAGESIYVGDHARDIEAGKRAEMLTIAAAFGYILNPEEVATWQADIISDSGQALLTSIQQLFMAS